VNRRSRSIEVLRLAQRIAAELESGRVDEVDMDDETVDRVAAMLAPTTAIVATTTPTRLQPRHLDRGEAQLSA
jgi:hypothetical protein